MNSYFLLTPFQSPSLACKLPICVEEYADGFSWAEEVVNCSVTSKEVGKGFALPVLDFNVVVRTFPFLCERAHLVACAIRLW